MAPRTSVEGAWCEPRHTHLRITAASAYLECYNLLFRIIYEVMAANMCGAERPCLSRRARVCNRDHAPLHAAVVYISPFATVLLINVCLMMAD